MHLSLLTEVSFQISVNLLVLSFRITGPMPLESGFLPLSERIRRLAWSVVSCVLVGWMCVAFEVVCFTTKASFLSLATFNSMLSCRKLLPAAGGQCCRCPPTPAPLCLATDGLASSGVMAAASFHAKLSCKQTGKRRQTRTQFNLLLFVLRCIWDALSVLFSIMT